MDLNESFIRGAEILFHSGISCRLQYVPNGAVCGAGKKKNLGMEQEAATVNAKKAFWSSSLQNKTQWQLLNQLLENTLFILFFSIKTVIHKI